MKRYLVIVFFLCVFFALGGCQKIRKVFTKPTPGEISKESYTVRYSGYEQRVTVKADSEELMDFLGSTQNWLNVAGTDLNAPSSGPELNQEQIELGSSFEFNVKRIGIEISGKMILIRATDEEMWFVWDNPLVMQIQRWSFEPSGEDTLLTINIATELPDMALVQIVEEMGLAETVSSEIDYMLANIQARFDPSVSPEDLVSKGLRGELYETFFQANKASTWVSKTPEEAVREGFAPENFREILQMSKVEALEECIYDPENRLKWEGGGTREPFYCPSGVHLAGRDWKTENFILINPDDIKDFFIMYGIAAGSIFRLEISGKAEGDGSRVDLELIIEPPGPATPNMMEAFIALTGLPDWIEDLLLAIKSKVEGVG